MREHHFIWHESNPLRDALLVPIYRASILLFHDYARRLNLWRADGTWLEIQSEMVEVASRLEVGVLSFKVVTERPEDNLIVEFEKNGTKPSDVKKLVIQEADVTIESGVVLEISGHKPLSIVAGSFPLSLAIDGFGPLPRGFEPEYPIEMYATSEL